MQLTLKRDGLEELYLMIPTYFDDIRNMWCCSLVIPKCKKALFAEGSEMPDLMKNFDSELTSALDEFPEIQKMFKPANYWKGRI